MSTNINPESLLSVLLWNANGTIQHTNGLQIILQLRKIDIALITETHLTPTKSIRIPGYILYRTDHPDGTAHAGTAILVSTDIEHNVLPQPISLLPTCGKLFEKLLLKRLSPIVSEKKIIPNTQFGFRSYHSTIHQVHRLTDYISSSLETKQYCPRAFLDVSQAFDRVWRDGLLVKSKLFLPAPYYLILKSYLEERFFAVRHGNSMSNYHKIIAGVPQGSDLSPILYNIFTYDIPQTTDTILATYADDTAILSSDNDPQIATQKVQNHLNLISSWTNQWKIKLNQTKSTQINFTLNRRECPPLVLNNNPLPNSSSIKYLGITIDKRLTWKEHTTKKRKQCNARLHLLRPIFKSKLSLKNKILIYKVILTPIWTYGIQIWGQAKLSNIRPLEAFQSISLRVITGCPWYVTNQNLHNDLNIPTPKRLAHQYYKIFHNKLSKNKNPLISQMSSLTIPGNPIRRLKRKWPRESLNQ
ncbi:Endonuclease/exonuclease/phosphatase,Reverse transcriptase domain [Cinara cedri]|uniref:Endonuclease/exonuclease/phosphatase,Reverse transcriptase domain n=1 Tax=Cinara cedri TaxID=506608 RepID=A0A5E4NGH5_9HEMI|nr:Endonuclease/exonuclease/phosphatase,Reverse transcriptase domain [Cinara cedri]